MKNKQYIVVCACVLCCLGAKAQTAVKTNLFYDATTTLNLSMEWGLGSRWSLDLSGNYNPWTFSDNKKWKHWLVQPEVRWWTRETMHGSFLAAHVLGGQFNMGGWDTDFKFLGNDLSVLEDHRVEGWMAGAGIGYGYSWKLAKHLNLEAELALGYAYMDYDKYKCARCGEKVEGDKVHHYVGPTKVALNLVYVFPTKKERSAETEIVPPLRIDTVMVPVQKPELNFALAYVQPEADPVKARAVEGTARLSFAVGDSKIDADFDGNAAELGKIRESIDLLRGDGDLTITGISLHGYASPDGPYSYNEKLAAERTKSLEQYLKNRFAELSASLFSTASTAEDWDGVRAAMEGSSLESRDRMLDIIDDQTLTPDQKDTRMRSASPSDYAKVLEEIYPYVRRTDYRISYSVRDFSVEEARQVIREKPQKLSLNEMYLVANSYETGSEEFREVFDIAVRLFPDDENANLNAANAALSRGDTESAARFLAKAGDSPQAVNARGVLAAKQGDAAAARKLFEQAAEAGLTEATENLKELDDKTN